MWRQLLERRQTLSVGFESGLTFHMTRSKDLTSLSLHFIFRKVVIILLNPLGYSLCGFNAKGMFVKMRTAP